MPEAQSDTRGETQTTPTLWPPALGSHVMVYHDSLEGVLVYGGSRADRTFSDSLWSWDGTRWSGLPVIGPQPRIHAGVAYDGYRNRLVVFGGIGPGGGTLEDLWEWDGTTWEERDQGTVRPGFRDHHAMIYAPGYGAVVLFGGQDAEDGYPEATWLWDGDAWRLLDLTSPPPRATHRLAYDPGSATGDGRVLLVGGWGPEARFHDFWWFTRTAGWTRRDTPEADTPVPGPRGAHRVAFDEARGQLILFGGLGDSTPLDDTWLHTVLPIGWQRSEAPGPAARNVHGMSYDRGRERVVLFGGIGEAGRLDDLWEWDGSRWTERARP